MISDVTPLVSVDDLAAACAFLHDCLGFEVRAAFDGFAYCARDGGAIRLIAAPEGMDLSDPARQIMVYLDVDDVDALWAERAEAIMALAPEDRQEPSDTHYGQREFVIVHRHFAVLAGHSIAARKDTS